MSNYVSRAPVDVSLLPDEFLVESADGRKMFGNVSPSNWNSLIDQNITPQGLRSAPAGAKRYWRLGELRRRLALLMEQADA